MLRVKDTILNKQNGKYYLDDTLYSGIIFFLDGCEISSKKVCQDGLIVSDYNNELIDYEGQDEIDYDCIDTLDEDSMYYYYGKQKFNGIAYGFHKKGYCTDEMLFIDGYDETSLVCGFSQEGELENFEKTSDKHGRAVSHLKYKEDIFSQMFDWYHNISTRIYLVYNKPIGNEKHIKFEMRCTKIGEMDILHIPEGYFQHIDEFQRYSHFPIYTKKLLLESSLLCAEYLRIEGKDFDDEIFLSMFVRNALKNVKDLHIYNTSLTHKSYQSLKELKGLEKLQIRTDTDIKSLLYEIKEHSQPISIILNDKEIL